MKPVVWQREDGVIAYHKQEEVDSQGFKWRPLYTAPRELSDDDIDLCAEETGMWCDGTPDAWDTKAIHNFARAILKKASEK